MSTSTARPTVPLSERALSFARVVLVIDSEDGTQEAILERPGGKQVVVEAWGWGEINTDATQLLARARCDARKPEVGEIIAYASFRRCPINRKMIFGYLWCYQDELPPDVCKEISDREARRAADARSGFESRRQRRNRGR